MENKDMNASWEELSKRLRAEAANDAMPLEEDLFPQIMATYQRKQRIRKMRRVIGWSAAAAVLVKGVSLWLMRQPVAQEKPWVADVVLIEVEEMPMNETIRELINETQKELVQESANKPMNVPMDKPMKVSIGQKESDPVESAMDVESVTEQVTTDVEEVPVQQSQSTVFVMEPEIGEEPRYLAAARRPWRLGIASNIQGTAEGGLNSYDAPMAVAPAGSGEVRLSNRDFLVPLTTPSYHFPISVTLQLTLPLAERWSVQTGFSYTILRSQYEALQNNLKQVLVDQDIHYLGIPLQLNYRILKYERLGLYLAGGGMVEKAVALNYELLDLDGKQSQYAASVKGVQWSVNLGFGLEYYFSDFVGVFVDPSLVYYFDSSQPLSLRTEEPLQLKLDIGLRFQLFR